MSAIASLSIPNQKAHQLYKFESTQSFSKTSHLTTQAQSTSSQLSPFFTSTSKLSVV